MEMLLHSVALMDSYFLLNGQTWVVEPHSRSYTQLILTNSLKLAFVILRVWRLCYFLPKIKKQQLKCKKGIKKCVYPLQSALPSLACLWTYLSICSNSALPQMLRCIITCSKHVLKYSHTCQRPKGVSVQDKPWTGTQTVSQPCL